LTVTEFCQYANIGPGQPAHELRCTGRFPQPVEELEAFWEAELSAFKALAQRTRGRPENGGWL